MLRMLKKLKGFKIYSSVDDSRSSFGKVKDIYFDDATWTLRYLVVDTGDWLTTKDVLISPYAVKKIDWEDNSVWVTLSRSQIEHSPGADTDKPVSRQLEERYNRYYNWPSYWDAETGGLWAGYIPGATPGMFVQPPTGPVPPSLQKDVFPDTEEGDMHLRSLKEVVGYGIKSKDRQEFGHVEDMLLDANTWSLRYILVDTRNFWPGSKRVLLSPHWVQEFNWEKHRMFAGFDRKTIEDAPAFDDDKFIDRNYENELHQYFGRPFYWEVDEDWPEPKASTSYRRGPDRSP